MKILSRILFAAAALTIVFLFGCSYSSPPPSTSSQAPDLSKSRQHAFEKAEEALHKQIDVPRRDIAGVSQDDVTWEDSCLGCARTGEKCTHVMTPGYRITLRVRDAQYEYHSDRGGKVRLCGQEPVPSAAAPRVAPTPLDVPH